MVDWVMKLSESGEEIRPIYYSFWKLCPCRDPIILVPWSTETWDELFTATHGAPDSMVYKLHNWASIVPIGLRPAPALGCTWLRSNPIQFLLQTEKIW
jgi:hypothetical protein